MKEKAYMFLLGRRTDIIVILLVGNHMILELNKKFHNFLQKSCTEVEDLSLKFKKMKHFIPPTQRRILFL